MFIFSLRPSDPFSHDLMPILSVDSTYFVSVASYYNKDFPVRQICTKVNMMWIRVNILETVR